MQNYQAGFIDADGLELSTKASVDSLLSNI